MKAYRQHGFTIVELLIVIVIIAILAAITIIAFNGVQRRANESASSAGVSNAAKKVVMSQQINGVYPADLTIAGVDLGGSTTYQYTATGTTFCVTGTTNNVSMYESNTQLSPQKGGCSGHAVDGVSPVTNLVTNPSIEVDTSSWGGITGASVSRVTSGLGIVSGSAALEVVLTNGNQSGAQLVVNGLTPGTNYKITGTVTFISGDNTFIGIRVGDGQGTKANQSLSLSTGVPTPISLTWSSGTQSYATFQLWREGNTTGPATVRIDAVMVQLTSSSSSYADGSTSGWAWNGTPNASTSSGPPK